MVHFRRWIRIGHRAQYFGVDVGHGLGLRFSLVMGKQYQYCQQLGNLFKKNPTETGVFEGECLMRDCTLE